MTAATRLWDDTLGICDIGAECCAHTRQGENDTGSPNVTINNIKAHRLTDTGPCRCPHSGRYESVEGSPNVTVNSLPLTRIDDLTICRNCGQPGHHIEGSPNVTVNGGNRAWDYA